MGRDNERILSFDILGARKNCLRECSPGTCQKSSKACLLCFFHTNFTPRKKRIIQTLKLEFYALFSRSEIGINNITNSLSSFFSLFPLKALSNEMVDIELRLFSKQSTYFTRFKIMFCTKIRVFFTFL